MRSSENWNSRPWLEALLTGNDGATDLAAPTDEGGAPEVCRASDAIAVTTIVDQTTLDEWLSRLSTATLFAFDTETTSLNYMIAEVVGVSFALEAGAAAYVPLAHDYPGAPESAR